MKKLILISLFVIPLSLISHAFCGFYVAQTDAKLFNSASEVILVRDGNRSIVTMRSDYKGSTSDFAMVIPVPVVLQREDIRLVNDYVFQSFDNYSGPRLAEYYDENPCQPRYKYSVVEDAVAESAPTMKNRETMVEKDEMNVTIEAQYAVGEYDILILSATESDGLKRWLLANGYKIPDKAERVLEPYIKSKMKFFVVKVNLEAHALGGSPNLRPIQIEFESNRFMLPIRLGMANSQGDQDMIVYTFSKIGRVETANYRTLEMPSNREVPTFVKGKFNDFYRDLFNKSHRITGQNSVFVEYAWDVTPSWGGVKCDPCSGPPPMTSELQQAGVKWVANGSNNRVYFTRLHVRYSEELFPEDLFFIETPNTTSFQSRYVVRHPAGGDMSCDEGAKYMHGLIERRTKELMQLEVLTDWEAESYYRYVDRGTSEQKAKKNEAIPYVKGPDKPSNPLRPLLVFMAALVSILTLIYLMENYKKYRSFAWR